MNVYFINSSLPFFIATELQRSSQEKSICFLCPTLSSFTDSEVKYAKEIFSDLYVLDLSKINIFSALSCLIYVAYKLRNIKIINLYVGNIGVSFLKLIYNHLCSDNKFLLEDGTSTLSFSKLGVNYYNYKNDSKLKDLLFKKFISLENCIHKVVSVFDISNENIQTKNIQLSHPLKDKLSLENELLILGGPQLNLNQLTIDVIEESITKLIKFHKEKYKIDKVIYKPHPREIKSDVNKLINILDMTLFDEGEFDIFELYFINSKKFPRYISSLFPSSALFVLNNIDSRINLSCVKFDEKHIFEDHKEETKIIAKYTQDFDTINLI